MDRIVDDHDFRINLPLGRRGSCRVQVFTAPGEQPVVVATQTMPASGVSLTNAAERFASAVWQRYLPDSIQPPRWIEHYEWGPQATQDRPHWFEVRFGTQSGRTVASPSWQGCGGAEKLAELLGGWVDPSRGDYTPLPLPPAPQPRFAFVSTLRLPQPAPFREPSCMPSGSTVAARCWRQLRPRPAADCCWYHGGDWRPVMAAVTKVVGPVAGRRLTTDEVTLLTTRVSATFNSGWLEEAATSLLRDPLIVAADGEWINGQHRGQAIMDAGCRTALTEVTDD